MSFPDQSQSIEQQIHSALLLRDLTALKPLIDEAHAADLAELFYILPTAEKQLLLDTLTDEQAAEILDELDSDERAATLDLLSVERTSAIIAEMPSDEAADLLAELPSDEANALLQQMEPELADDVVDLLRYQEDTAGGLMVKEYVCISPDDTVEEVLALLRRHHDDAEMIYFLYVQDEEERLLGEVTLRNLIISAPDVTVSQIMTRDFESVPVTMPQEEVADIVRKHGLLAIPVLDDEGRLQGIITIDDIGDVVEEEAADELMEASGSEEQEESKIPWLSWQGWRSGLLATLGGILTALVIALLLPADSSRTAVATLLPMLIILCITTSSQSATAVDRAYEWAVEHQQIGLLLYREMLTGGLLALLSGILTWGLLFLIGPPLRPFAFILAVSLAIPVWVASITGSLGTLIAQRRDSGMAPTSLTFVIMLALLCAVTAYLGLCHWAL